MLVLHVCFDINIFEINIEGEGKKNLQVFQQYYDGNVVWPSLCQFGHIKMGVYRNKDELQQ